MNIDKGIDLVKYYIFSSNVLYLILYSNEGLHQLLTFIFVSLAFINQIISVKETEIIKENNDNYQCIIFGGDEDNNGRINYNFELNCCYILNVTIDSTSSFLYLVSFNEQNDKQIKLTSKLLLNADTDIDIVIFNVNNTIKITTGYSDCVLDVKINKLL